VRRVAEAKARAGAAVRPGTTVLAADTVVVISNRILGKPTDRASAQEMLRTLSGREHEVLTAVALIAPPSRKPLVEVARTRVRFASLSEAEIGWYVASGEPMDKAGAYAIQGLASRFVERIEGSYSNVVGLPVSLVYRMFARAGVSLHGKP
jgi:nucleoside triphosphate pyrophosphatase